MSGEKNAKDLLGARFGRLVVIEKTNQRTSDRHVVWRCKCDCGNECFVQSNSLTTNKTKSCGCLLTYEGETHTITEWSKITGIKRKIISQRVNKLGWSIERALTEKEE